MKFNKIIFATLAASIFVASCDTFDQPALSEYDDAVVYSNITLTQHALNSIYDSYTPMSSYRSDWFQYYGANTDVDFWQASNITNETHRYCKYDMPINPASLNQATWQYFYGGNMQGIERANIVLSGLEEYADLDNNPEMRNAYGEALTARALLYLDLLRYYGEAPARFKPVSAETAYLPNVNTDIIYKQLLSDLQKAAEMMDYSLATSTGRPTKACAQGIYARIALQAAGYSLRCADDKWNTGDSGTYALSNDPALKPEATYQIALDGLEEAIKNSGFKLDSDFEHIWRVLANKRLDVGGEFVFQLPFSDIRGQLYFHNGVPNPGIYKVHQTVRKGLAPVFYFKYDKDDIRRNITCVPCQYGEDGKGIGATMSCGLWYNGKYRWDYMDASVVPTGNDDGVKFGYLRITDMYLMAAEIANELGDTEKAISYLRPVLERAFKNTPEKVDAYLNEHNDKDSFFEAIKEQRAFEFAGEFLRKGDLIRWGILKDALDQTKQDILDLKERKGKYSGFSNDIYYHYAANGKDIEIWDPTSTENPMVTDPTGGWAKKASYFSSLDKNLGNNIYVKDPIQNMWRPIPSAIIVSNLGVLKNDFGYSTPSTTEE